MHCVLHFVSILCPLSCSLNHHAHRFRNFICYFLTLNNALALLDERHLGSSRYFAAFTTETKLLGNCC